MLDFFLAMHAADVRYVFVRKLFRAYREERRPLDDPFKRNRMRRVF